MDLGVGGRTYIIIGGSRGMGYETARALAAEGARLTLVGRTTHEVAAAAGRLEAEFGAEALAVTADAARPGDLDAAVAASVDRFGPPRGLLVASGLTDLNADLLEADESDWEHNFQDVFMGTMRGVRAVLPPLVAAGGGQIVTCGSFTSRVPKGRLFPYAAMKAAVVNFTKNVARTYGGQGVRANCVCPGAFATDRVNTRIEAEMAQSGRSREAASAYVVSEVFNMSVALGRAGEPHEAGELMAFLLSERAAYLTGAVINIDGGTVF
ncbi:MAG: SDR family oxidoreductase [Dehalococcoidia bacterium]|nr:SDR family oxidoreductase [Dehalococcoidia bacterium]